MTEQELDFTYFGDGILSEITKQDIHKIREEVKKIKITGDWIKWLV